MLRAAVGEAAGDVEVPLRGARRAGCGEIAPSCRGVIELEAEAAARWKAGGSRAGELARRRAAQEARELASRLAEQQRLTRYLRQGPGCAVPGGHASTAAVGLSGQPLADVGRRLFIEVGGGGKRRRRSSGQAAQPVAPAEPGFDRWDRWPVDGPFEVQRLQVGAERWLEARIRWRGVDPRTSLPYPEQWVRDRDEHGPVMNGALLTAARKMEAARYGCRVPRRAAAAPAARPANSRRCARLRSEDEIPIAPPRKAARRRARVVIEDSSDEEMLEEQMEASQRSDGEESGAGS